MPDAPKPKRPLPHAHICLEHRPRGAARGEGAELPRNHVRDQRDIRRAECVPIRHCAGSPRRNRTTRRGVSEAWRRALHTIEERFMPLSTNDLRLCCSVWPIGSALVIASSGGGGRETIAASSDPKKARPQGSHRKWRAAPVCSTWTTSQMHRRHLRFQVAQPVQLTMQVLRHSTGPRHGKWCTSQSTGRRVCPECG